MTKQRLPLENPDAERAVIGACLKDPAVYWTERARLKPELFADPLHRDIIVAVTMLAEKGRDFGIPALVGRIPERDGVSTPGYLAMLIADQADVALAGDLISDLCDIEARRKMMAYGERLIRAATEPSQASAQERLEKALSGVRLIGEQLQDDGDTPARAINEMLEDAQRAFSRRGSDGIPWFLREIHQVTADELEYGWLFGVLADSGGGKSASAMQQAYHAAKRGVPVLVLSCDQRPKDCYRQIAAQQLSIETSDIRKGRQSEAEFRNIIEFATDGLRQLPLTIKKIGRPKMTEVAGHVYKFKRERGRGLVILDHASRIYPENPKGDAGDRFNQIFADLKDLTASTDCATLVLMQRNSHAGNRDNPRPIDADILGGPGVRQNFDVLLAIYFEERWLRQKLRIATKKAQEGLEERIRAVAGRAELIGMKARYGPEGIITEVKWEPRFTRYVSPEAEALAARPELFEEAA